MSVTDSRPLFVKIARPYAKAAYKFARETGTEEVWLQELNQLGFVIQQKTVDTFIKSPRFSVTQKVDAVKSILNGMLSEPVIRFMHVLAKNHRLALLPTISALFEDYLAEDRKTIAVEITSSVSLDPTLLDSFTRGLRKRLEREVSVSTQIDASLIGGAIIRAGDLVIDGSVRNQLRKMAEVI